MRYLKARYYIPVLVLLAAVSACDNKQVLVINENAALSEWPQFGGDEGNTHYTAVDQITPGNVEHLQVAWTYNTGDVAPGALPDPFNSPAMQMTPILADETLYICSPLNRVIALNPTTGEELWHYDANPDTKGVYTVTCRGVAYHRDVSAESGEQCASRVLTGTMDGRLLAIDAKTGLPCEAFGQSGEVDLKAAFEDVRPGEYANTSPPVVVGDVVILGANIADNYRAGVPSGVIRGFDALTGALVWAWEPLPPGYVKETEGYVPGTPNAWAPLSADSERGLVFIPTGNPANDYWGGDRNGMDHYGSSIIALSAATGELVWNFQTVYHDVWDYDIASPPLLFDYEGENGTVPALAQGTKLGIVFVLNRETGEPIFPIEEFSVPSGGPAPEALSPVQIRPTLPEPLHPSTLTEDDMWGFTWYDEWACKKEFRALNYEGEFTPISTEPTLTYPIFMGGSSWGGLSWDPKRKLLVGNTSRLPAIIQLIPREIADQPGSGVEPAAGSPFGIKRRPFLSPFGAPCSRPPWGQLTAIDMTTGKHKWQIPLGSTRDLAPWPLWFDIGVPNTGGSLMTASGITFIGASTDSYFHAFDSQTGELLWKDLLPAGGNATPMSYRLPNGKQYVVIAAGGHAHLGSRLGDAIVAYALSD
jgi:quinoprotein glucose dehydrogenase